MAAIPFGLAIGVAAFVGAAAGAGLHAFKRDVYDLRIAPKIREECEKRKQAHQATSERLERIVDEAIAKRAEEARAARRKRDGKPKDSDNSPTPKQSKQETDDCPSRMDDILENVENISYPVMSPTPAQEAPTRSPTSSASAPSLDSKNSLEPPQIQTSDLPTTASPLSPGSLSIFESPRCFNQFELPTPISSQQSSSEHPAYWRDLDVLSDFDSGAEGWEHVAAQKDVDADGNANKD